MKIVTSLIKGADLKEEYLIYVLDSCYFDKYGTTTDLI